MKVIITVIINNNNKNIVKTVKTAGNAKNSELAKGADARQRADIIYRM